MPALRVILLWHQHQPFYKDLVTGEYRLPWTRLHALKDYYGMVKLLDEFPNVHQNVNLVPSLMIQIQDYVAGTAQDPFLSVASKPAKDLSVEERRFALQYTFPEPIPKTSLDGIPATGNYGSVFASTATTPSAPNGRCHFPDAGFHRPAGSIANRVVRRVFSRGKRRRRARGKGHNYSLDDQKFVIAREREVLGRVLPAHADAAKKGSIEISATPFYHPILPLVCDTGAGAVSSPGLPLPQNRFRHPEDAREQLTRGLDLHQKVSGCALKASGPRRKRF